MIAVDWSQLNGPQWVLVCVAAAVALAYVFIAVAYMADLLDRFSSAVDGLFEFVFVVVVAVVGGALWPSVIVYRRIAKPEKADVE